MSPNSSGGFDFEETTEACAKLLRPRHFYGCRSFPTLLDLRTASI